MTSKASSSSSSLRNHVDDNRPLQSSPLRPSSGTASNRSLNASKVNDHPAPAPQRGSENNTSTTLMNSAVVSARERFVSNYHRLCGSTGCDGTWNGECEHGALSPHVASPHGEWDNPMEREHGSYGKKHYSRGGDLALGGMGHGLTDDLSMQRRGNGNGDDEGVSKGGSAEWLPRRHIVKGSSKMYV